MRAVAPALAAALRKSRGNATKVEKARGPNLHKLMVKKAVGKLKRGATFWDHAEKRNR